MVCTFRPLPVPQSPMAENGTSSMEAVIFDLDGTILDTETVLKQVVVQVRGCPLTP